jgi:hypothetical protein
MSRWYYKFIKIQGISIREKVSPAQGEQSFISEYVCKYVYTYLCVCVCIYICIYTCIYIYVVEDAVRTR